VLRPRSLSAYAIYGGVKRPCVLCTLACSAVAFSLLAGCGGDRGPERAVVSGIVTFRGKPVRDGTVRFVPTAGSNVPTAGASIADGRYKADGHGGVPVGTHKIQVEAFRKAPLPLKPGAVAPRYYDDGGVPEQFIPARYNSNTQLEIVIPPGSAEITKDLVLTD
jgi:hypothetical protein